MHVDFELHCQRSAYSGWENAGHEIAVYHNKPDLNGKIPVDKISGFGLEFPFEHFFKGGGFREDLEFCEQLSAQLS